MLHPVYIYKLYEAPKVKIFLIELTIWSYLNIYRYLCSHILNKGYMWLEGMRAAEFKMYFKYLNF